MLALVIASLSGSAPAGTAAGPIVRASESSSAVVAHQTGRGAPVGGTHCPSAHKAVRFYARRLNQHRAKMGARPTRTPASLTPCPRYLARVLQRKAFAWRKRAERWIESRTLRDFVVRDGNHAWSRAVEEVQVVFPGTRAWLLSCSAPRSEGGHGRWVPNTQGSGAGGWLQFMESTFWRMYGAAAAEARARGFRIPRSAASWYSPLGQALAGAWGYLNGRRHEWHGAGC